MKVYNPDALSAEELKDTIKKFEGKDKIYSDLVVINWSVVFAQNSFTEEFFEELISENIISNDRWIELLYTFNIQAVLDMMEYKKFLADKYEEIVKTLVTPSQLKRQYEFYIKQIEMSFEKEYGMNLEDSIIHDKTSKEYIAQQKALQLIELLRNVIV